MADMTEKLVGILIAVSIVITLIGEVQTAQTTNGLDNATRFGSGTVALIALTPFLLVVGLILFILKFKAHMMSLL